MWRYAKNKLYGAAIVLALIGAIPPAIVTATAVIQSNICSDFAAPTITSPATGFVTQDNTVIVSGAGEPSLSITISENEIPVAITSVSSSGDYSVSIPLSGGENVIIAKGVNACGSVKESGAMSVQRNIVPQTPVGNDTPDQATAPIASIAPVTSSQTPTATLNQPIPAYENASSLSVPTINQPSPGATYTASTIWITGTTEPSSLVTIYLNGVSVAKLRASSAGSFGAMIQLSIGRNSIQVGAEKDGKSAISQPTVVFYTPPKSTGKTISPVVVAAVITGATVATVAATSGGAWVIRFISARRLR